MIEQLRTLRRHINRWGWRGPPFLLSKLAHSYLLKRPNETSIWDRDWDMLIVLDCCRAEWLHEIKSEYTFIDDPETINSVASHSHEWINRTFGRASSETLENTIYITANHWAERGPQDCFQLYKNVRKYDEYPLDWGSPPAHLVTDTAIRVSRKSEWERLILHYMQPHRPFYEIPPNGTRRDAIRTDVYPYENDLFLAMAQGEISRNDVENLYIDNLRYVLDEVDVLLKNINANRVAITSDHGEALGERFLYDHERNVLHDVLKKVPWTVTHAQDENTIEPINYSMRENDNETAQQQLKALGYL